jgi:transposase
MPRELAGNEALCLLKLLRSGETVESLRRLIGNQDPYRRRVQLHFDLLTNPERCQEQILRALRAGWSRKKICDTLHCGPGIILRLSKQIKASTLKRGRGRRFTEETRQQILDAIKTAIADRGTSRAIERRFRIDYGTVKKFRRELGDYSNWRDRNKFEHAEEATAALHKGETWRQVAEQFHVGLATLHRHVKFRKRAQREEVAA